MTKPKRIDWTIAVGCIEANLPLLFSDRDFVPYVEHLGLEAACAAVMGSFCGRQPRVSTPSSAAGAERRAGR
jgi:hypothetical protein